MLVRAKDAEKRLRKESAEKDCLCEELRKVTHGYKRDKGGYSLDVQK